MAVVARASFHYDPVSMVSVHRRARTAPWAADPGPATKDTQSSFRYYTTSIDETVSAIPIFLLTSGYCFSSPLLFPQGFAGLSSNLAANKHSSRWYKRAACSSLQLIHSFADKDFYYFARPNSSSSGVSENANIQHKLNEIFVEESIEEHPLDPVSLLSSKDYIDHSTFRMFEALLFAKDGEMLNGERTAVSEMVCTEHNLLQNKITGYIREL